MTKSNFTKGPWLIKWNDYEACETVVSGKTDEMICVKVEEKDAHLIAAAPEMYAMLEQFLPINEDGNGSFTYNEGSEHMGEQVRILLSKARGDE